MMSSRDLQVVDTRGAILPGWPADLWIAGTTPRFVDFVVADLDADGQKEIVARVDINNLNGTALCVFGADAQMKIGWPQIVNNQPVWIPSAHPAAGDLDGDGDLEIVLPAYDGKVHAYQHDGTIVAGWPQQTIGVPANSPAVGDIDGDGRAEVVVGNDPVIQGYNAFDHLYAWRGDGTLLPGWPVKREGPFDFIFYGFGPPLLADVDGDGAVDIVASGDHPNNHEVVMAYRLDGSLVPGFPKHAPNPGASATTSPAIADLDGDGLLELAWVDFDNLLYIWDLPSARSAPAPWPMYRHDPALTGTNYSSNFKVRPSVQLSDKVYYAGESTGSIQFTITRTGDSSNAISVSYATGDGTAAADADYTTTFGTVTFAAGDMTAKIITVPIAHDVLDEYDEPFNLTLSAPTGGATLGPRSSALLTITDDDPTPSLSVSDVSVTEGNRGTTNVAFNVTLSAQSGRLVTVNYVTADGTANANLDYTAASGSLYFGPGETTKTITVQVKGDLTDEPNETFKLLLSAPTNALISDHEALCTITDNDLTPTLSVNSLTVVETNATSLATFTITLSAASTQPVKVNYATANNTALAPADYTAKALTTVTFLPSQTTKTIAVSITGDLLDEPAESFRLLLLSSPVNATIAVGAGTCSITDNDAPPSIIISNVNVTEPDSGVVIATFTVKPSAASGQTITVRYATANGTTAPATAGTDYTAIALTTLTFLPGETSKSVSVQVTGDLVKEAHETFFVNLSGPINATIADVQGLATILNDD